MKEFKEYLLDSILGIIWRQWSALGIYTNVEPENTFIVDPESLLCVTFTFGRYDQRLFDEAVGWLRENGHLLNIDRLKSVLKNFREFETDTLGAVAEYLVLKEKKRKWERVVRFCERTKKEKDEQNYFMTRDFNSIPVIGKHDEIFLKWGILRPDINLPRTTRELDFERPCNLLFKLRSFFGVNSRADICAYLLLSGKDNSLQISRKIYFNQRNVYQVLSQLYASGLLEKKNFGQRGLYSIDKEHWGTFLKFDEDISYVIWPKVFSAISYLFKQILSHPDHFADSYLASSKMREISDKFIPEIETSGLRIQSMNTARMVGESFTPQFVSYVKEILHQLLGMT